LLNKLRLNECASHRTALAFQINFGEISMVKIKWSASLLMIVLWLGVAAIAYAQGTAFNYQGKLIDNGNPGNGQYDFQFKLFDTQTIGTGNPFGLPVTVLNVTVTNGIFTASLDFGPCPSCFDGSARFLEIAVKPSSSMTFTTLGPRQPINTAPYAIKSLSAAVATTADGLSLACASCVTSNQILSIQGSKVTGNIAGSQINGPIPVASVPSGSSLYVQNQTASAQSANFNISGSGIIAGVVGIGTTAPVAALDVQRDGNVIPETARFTTYGFANEILGRSSGGTRAAPTATPVGRILMQLGATGHDGGADFVANPKATIQLSAAENWTASAQGTLIRFNTTAIGTTTTNTKMIIKDDGSVGIGTTTPTAPLEVNGDVKVSGNIIIPSQTRHLSIPGAGFTPTERSGYLISGDGIAIANVGNLFDPMTAAAMVNLPDGAVVTRIRANVVDSDNGSGQNIRVRLERKGLNGDTGLPEVMADVSSSGMGQNILLSDTSISNATIDNGNFSYYIRLTSPAGADFTWYLYSLIIDYTITSPLP
jgi:hypothetical protein